MRRVLIAAALLAAQAAAGTASAADRPRVVRGVPYLTESIRLTNAKWQPITLEGSQGCRDGDSRCRDRPEVRSCSPDALGRCTFTWWMAPKVVEVVTEGRDPARVVGTRCLLACR